MASSRQTDLFLYAAYGVVMTCMAALLYQSFNHWEVSRAARQIDLELEEKVRTAFEMRDAIRKRSFSLAYVTILDDFFDRDEQRQASWEAANDFVDARARLEQLGTDARELEYLKHMTEQIRHAQPYTERAMNLAVEGVRGPKMEEAITASRLAQAELLKTLDNFVEHLDANAQQKQAAQEIYLAAIRRDMLILGGAMFVVSLTIGLAVTRRESANRNRLLSEIDERTQAENMVRDLNRTLEVRVETRTNELWESEVRSRAIVETAVEGIITIDDLGFIETANPAAERIFHYTTDELVGHKISMLIPVIRDDYADYIQQFQDKGKAYILGLDHEVEGLRKNGESFPLSLAVSEMRMDNERHFVSIISDLTERKKVEAEKTMLAADHEIVAAILNASLTPVLLEDFLDEALRLILKRQNLELLGMGAIFLIDEDTPEKLTLVAHRNLAPQLQTKCAQLEVGQCLCGRAAQQGKTVIKTCLDHEHEVTYEGISEHGHMCTPISHGEQILGVLNLYIPHDHHPSKHEKRLVETVADTLAGVIWRNRAEEIARVRQDELAHVSRVNTMGELTANLAHEINQPLSAISNYAKGSIRRMQSNSLDRNDTGEIFDKIAREAERAGDVMRRIRSFIRKGEVSLQPLTLNQVVEDTLLLISFEAKRQGVVIKTKCDPDAVTILADKVQIEQVLLNILNNAMDALSHVPKKSRKISVKSWNISDQEVICSIWDNGPGLPPEFAEKVFEPFYSQKSNGMGMGLSISRSIIEASGGRLWVDVDCTKGTRFNFSLPIKMEQ
ncbi:MAG: PAS domain S-box protein [Magnetovibrio sp.]|nr:PAS domain S-box protein [Magnetovibrio sp.]